jgi:chromosomal replication initiator protein
MDDKEIVAALRECLADKVGRDRFDLWLGDQSRLTVRGDALLIELPSRFVQDWVRCNFRREMEAAGAEVLRRPVAIEFRIDTGLARGGLATKRAARRSGSSSRRCGAAITAEESATSIALADPPADVQTTLFDQPAEQPLFQTAHCAARDEPGDCSISPRRRFAALEAFVVGPSNRMAHASAQMVVEEPGRFSPLFVYGPTGVGKTHLLEGILIAARKRHPRIHAIYLSAEQFTTYFVEALHGSGLPNFRRKYRGVQLLIIDDVQFFARKTATIGELLFTMDTLIRQGSQIVLSADRSPTELRELSPEFTARLAAGIGCHVDPPDYQTRLGILRHLAAKIGFALPDDVAEFIATHLTSHARELAGALNRLDAAERIWKKPITRALAEDALAEMIRHGARAVRLADIDKAVCEVFGLEAETLQSGRRAKDVSHLRMLAMFLARKHTRAALSEIGQHFGRRSHSTVISAHKAVTGWVAKETKIELTGKSWTVEEAIRRVEEQLRTA